MKRHKTVDAYIEAEGTYRAELELLREMLNETELEETVKWGAPCYTINGKNVVGLGAFKSYFGLWFFQGALLKDEKKLLVNAQEGTTRALRQMRFQSARDINRRIVRAYLKEAIGNQRANRAIKADRSKPLTIPPELAEALVKNKQLEEAFDALAKGRQREYADHIAEAKRPETKAKRLAKTVPMILEGKGLHDKYRSC